MNTYSFRKDLLAVQEELLRFAYKLTADREEANDLLQETSLKALDNEDKYEPDTNFKGWMYTIMRNIFMVAHVFHSVASKYDVMNDLMSFGIHRLWDPALEA